MKVYVTKYALTKGIIEMDVTQSKNYPTMVSNKENSWQTIHKPYWHENREDAVIHSQELLKKKMKSLRNMMNKLEKMTFE
jgi:hypothetical protein